MEMTKENLARMIYDHLRCEGGAYCPVFPSDESDPDLKSMTIDGDVDLIDLSKAILEWLRKSAIAESR